MADDNVRFVNPLASGFDFDETKSRSLSPTRIAGESDFDGPSIDRAQLSPNSARMADFDHDLTDDELGDLTFAFQALDCDGNGTVEPVELHAMVAVLAGPDADVTMDMILKLFVETKAEFQTWMETQGETSILPDWMDLDLVQGQGVHGQTATGVDRHHATLDIQKNATVNNAVLKRANRFRTHPLVKPISAGATQTSRALQMSAGLVKGLATGATKPFRKNSKAVQEKQLAQARKELQSLMFSPDHMIFAEYLHLMCSSALIGKYFKNEDWHKRASSMRKFRHAFDTADVNGDNSLEFDELEMVILAMDSSHNLAHDDLLYLWEVMTREEPGVEKRGDSLNFVQYLHGLANSKKDERTKNMLKLDARNKFELLSLLIDTPVSEADEANLLEGLTGLEKMGIAMLKKDRRELDKAKAREVLNKAGAGTLRALNPDQVIKMRSLKSQMTWLSGFIGFVCTIVPCWVENILCAEFGVDGVKNTYFNCDQLTRLDVQDNNGTLEYSMNVTGNVDLEKDLLLVSCTITQSLGYWEGNTYFGTEYPTTYVDGPQSQCMPGASWDPQSSVADRCMSCECMACSCIPHDDGKLVVDMSHPLIIWWVILGIAIAVNVVFEIGALMFFAVRYCVRVSWALDQRLVPLNADRAFVADSLVRAAFELGNPVSPVMGVDPGAEPKSKFKIFVLILAYKAKVVLTGAVIKALLGKITPVHVSTWAKPWAGTMGGAIIWDALISSCIVLQAQIRGFGVYTNCEVFNDILEHHFEDYTQISEAGQLQMVRCVGVSIVKSGSMYPTMELLLRHSIQYLHLRGKSAVAEPGNLDNEDLLLDNLKNAEDGGILTDEERRVAMSIYLLSCILDGDMGHAQMELWIRMCAVASDIAVFDQHRVRWLATRFRAFEMLTAADVHAVFDPAGDGESVPDSAKREYLLFELQNVLTC